MAERFITSTLNRKDEEVETTLRPQSFSSFPGQEKVKERMEVYVHAARSRNEPLGHLLLSYLYRFAAHARPPLQLKRRRK